MSRDWFDIALGSKVNILKKAKEKIKHTEEDDVRETHLCLLKIKTYEKR